MEERGEHDGALGCRGDLAVVEFSSGEASALTVESLTRGSLPVTLYLPIPLFLFLGRFGVVFVNSITRVLHIQIE
jgi:hypothetical protein